MAKATYPGPAAALEANAGAVEANSIPDLMGAQNPYTSRNGHMFSFLDRDGRAAIRLSDELRGESEAAHESGPVTRCGATMHGYAAVPGSLLTDTEAFSAWLDRSHDWIGTVEPKPTKR